MANARMLQSQRTPPYAPYIVIVLRKKVAGAAGNFIANSFPTRIIKSHPPKFVRTRIKSTTRFPGKRDPFRPWLSPPPLSLIFRRRTLYENVTFSCPTRVLAHTVPLCNGPWTNIDQQLVESLPRPAIKRHESLLDSQDLRISRVFFLFHFTKAVRLCVSDMSF